MDAGYGRWLWYLGTRLFNRKLAICVFSIRLLKTLFTVAREAILAQEAVYGHY